MDLTTAVRHPPIFSACKNDLETSRFDFAELAKMHAM
jgi:hypothetical protein